MWMKMQLQTKFCNNMCKAESSCVNLCMGKKSTKYLHIPISKIIFQLAFPLYSTLLSVTVSIAVISYGGYILASFCIFRSDVCGFNGDGTHNGGVVNNDSPDNEDITANLVELCPRPLPTNSSDRTSSLRPTQQVKDVNVVRDVMVAPPCPSLFGPSSKVNNLN